MKKIFRWVKIIWFLAYIILITGFIAWLGFMTWSTMMNEGAANPVNFISLAIGMVSLPGAFVQLISLSDINNKKEYIATTKCPNCRQTVDLRLKEV